MTPRRAGRPIGGPLEYSSDNPLVKKLLELVNDRRGNGNRHGHTLEAIAHDFGVNERTLRRWLAEKSRIPYWLRRQLQGFKPMPGEPNALRTPGSRS